MTGTTEQDKSSNSALQRLIDREEILQICYWYLGEGFGDVYNSAILQPFLGADAASMELAFEELTQQGYFVPVSEPIQGYRFTKKGRKESGRLFSDNFADFQKSGHGECAAGCCDGDDHSKCGNDCILH